MYKCECCGHVTEELDSYKEFHYELDDCPYEELADWECGCGGEYEEVEQCSFCGEYFRVGEMGFDWCQRCLEDYKTPELILFYIDSDVEIQREFYLNGTFWNWECESAEAFDRLIELGKKQYQELQELGKEFPSIKRHLLLQLEQFTQNDLSHFYSWMTDSSQVTA